MAMVNGDGDGHEDGNGDYTYLMATASTSLAAGLSLRGDHQRHPKSVCSALPELRLRVVDRVEDVLKELLNTLHKIGGKILAVGKIFINLEEEGGHAVSNLPQHHHCGVAASFIPLRSGQPFKSLLHLVINEIKLQVGRVHPRDLGQPGNGLGGQLNDCKVQLVSLSQAVVLQVVPKPEENILCSFREP